MAKITLGGERLGSGKKMEVNIPEFGRSSHDQGFVFTTDQAFGTLVPALCQVGTRGDVFYLNDITSLVRTLPTNGPVFGSVKQQIDVFAAPMRLYIGALHNNMTGIGLKMDQIKFPVTEHLATTESRDWKLKNPNQASVSQDSLSAYLGSRGSRASSAASPTYTENAIFELFYWDIYKNYYANKQEEEGVVIAPEVGETYQWTSVTIENEGTGTAIYSPGNNYQQESFQLSAADEESVLKITIEYTTPQSIVIAQNVTIETQAGTQNLSNYATATGKKFEIINGEGGLGTSKKWIFTMEAGIGMPGLYVPENTGNVVYPGVEPIPPVNGIGLTRFPLSNIDDMREAILSAPIGTPLVINKVKDGITPYNVGTKTLTDVSGEKRETRSLPMCGLAIKCHLSDMFNNWLQTDWIDGENGINELTSIDTSSGSFTVNEFILDYKLFKMMNRIAISDGSYDAWQTAVYGQEGRVITESPVYCGGYSSEIAFDEVVSNAASGEEPLGSLAGRGSQQGGTRKGGKNIKIKCDEATLIMVICSFTPRTTYSQGQQWWLTLESMDDLHKPDLDGIAFQNLLQKSMGQWAQSSRGNSLAVGKQPSWLEYTTEVNHTFGSFCPGQELEHMVFNRTYKADEETGNIENITTYIDPTEFNVVFADQSLSAKPFWVQIGFDLTSRRKMSASQIPNL